MATADPVVGVMVKVPSPIAPPTGSSAAEVVDWALASAVMDRLNAVGCVPPMAVAVTALELVDVAVTALNAVTLASWEAASDKVETSDLIWPKAEILACISLALVCRPVRGCFSTATSWATILLTSRPLPIPGEVIVAIANSLKIYGPSQIIICRKNLASQRKTGANAA
jgi:hypothetical protein